MNSNQNETTQNTNMLPMIPLRGVVVLPENVMNLDLIRSGSIVAAQTAANNEEKYVFLLSQKDESVEEPRKADLEEIGTIALIKHMMPMPDHVIRIMVEGVQRARVQNIFQAGDLQAVSFELMECNSEEETTDVELKACMKLIVSQAHKLVGIKGVMMPETMKEIDIEKSAGILCDLVAGSLFTSMIDRQKVLECEDIAKRCELTAMLLEQEIEFGSLEERVHKKVQELIEKNNRDYYVREQIHALSEEIKEPEDEEISDYQKQLAESKMPEEARKKVAREIKRLSKTAPQSPEASVSQNYIEQMLEMPWGKYDDSDIDINRTRQILEEDHYGLKEVKTRIVEYLAVRKFSDGLKSPILCLVGPPGVGKTSIAKSIARALNRKFTQVSLGGVHDEAEIRGHRKTYVGAMPGRVIAAMDTVGTMNPVFLFDEIDKITSDMRGDPAAALLEVLDPQQNKNFKDHYLETAFDLSDVLFITTANSTEPIDKALLDRLEIIEVPSYTMSEKKQIATRYLVPRQMEAHGLKEGQLLVSDTVLEEIIDRYTREAGVRNLERVVEKVCRKAVMFLMDHPEESCFELTMEKLHENLGIEKFTRQGLEGSGRIGIVNGLAWTSVGGEVMPVEALVLEGNGKIEMTGKLGDVMQESAKLALSIARMWARHYGIASKYFEKHDFHIHVPEGAVPKDGPSAGVALTCAIVSAIAGIPARNDLAMTGEITLHGKVLPIGGLREKLYAAYRMGIREVMIPKENEKDLEDIEEEIRSQMKIRLLGFVDEALETVLVKSPAR